MAYSSSSSSYLIGFHRGGVFVRDPFSYDYEMLFEIPNVDMAGMNFVAFVKLLNSMGLPRHAWPEGITLQDCIIHAATQSEIALSQSQQVESQEQEPRQQQPMRTSERIAQIMFKATIT
ncbi:hypothetical protein Tco_0442772 [Tanacetum coccineum]